MGGDIGKGDKEKVRGYGRGERDGVNGRDIDSGSPEDEKGVKREWEERTNGRECVGKRE